MFILFQNNPKDLVPSYFAFTLHATQRNLHFDKAQRNEISFLNINKMTVLTCVGKISNKSFANNVSLRLELYFQGPATRRY